jgi:hypothetical protein
MTLALMADVHTAADTQTTLTASVMILDVIAVKRTGLVAALKSLRLILFGMHNIA